MEIPVEIHIDPETASVSIRPIGRSPRIAENLVAAILPDSSADFLTKASRFLSGDQAYHFSLCPGDVYAPSAVCLYGP